MAYGNMVAVTQPLTETLTETATATATGATVDTVSAPGEVVHAADSPDAPWWRDAVIYQVYPRSRPTPTATAWATSPESLRGCRTCATSASMPCG